MRDVLVNNLQYCPSLTHYQRWGTREVLIGDIPVGGKHPIRIQSMTTTPTMDTAATVAQCIRLIEAGCDYVRITAPSITEAKNLANIKKELRQRGYNTPLIADIHFTPHAAEIAARIVEKVRINPGNYADKKKFEVKEYTDAEYEAELERIRHRFLPLVRVCKEYGTAMRIGVNHGSLSDRIMNRYGDTPLGMVESALEFVRICEEEGYYNIVLSMKASNPRVMVQAYRLLVNRLMETGRNYPLHIGVTEAGDGLDGRIKSAVGIGALLEDGIGDTIRVSLTEEPEAEVPVAKALVARYRNRKEHSPISPIEKIFINPFEYHRRNTIEVRNIGAKHAPCVVIDLSNHKIDTPEVLKAVGYFYDAANDKWNLNDAACDYIYLGKKDISFALPGSLGKIIDYAFWKSLKKKDDSYPLFTVPEFLSEKSKSSEINFVEVQLSDLTKDFIEIIRADQTVVLVLTTHNRHAMAELRRGFFALMEYGVKIPVIIKRTYDEEELLTLLYSATDCGTLLTDGLGDGIWISSNKTSSQTLNNISFGILQATRTRISRTEYIACPSCGRTLFDLQEVTQKIRSRTQHLKGVKIGIMGCIVNGPGEMADADYGYVGSGPGKITLYKGKEVVKRNVDTSVAVDELINLIKADGKWTEPPVLMQKDAVV